MGALVRPNYLVELIVALAHYREEGAKLHPEIFIFVDLQTALKLMPEHSLLPIGEGDLSESSVSLALKRCAPLAIGGWYVFLEEHAGKLCYGLFHGAANPLSVSVEETLFSGLDPAVKVIRIHQVAEDCVEIRSWCGTKHNVFMSHKRDTDPSPTKYLKDLVAAICAKVPPDKKDQASTFLLRTLSEAVRGSHGTIVAVSSQDRPPKFLKDGVFLAQPLQLPQIISAVQAKTSPEGELLSMASLIRGMIASDGLILFSPRASLLAFSCFVTSGKADTGISGGARRRAYDALCARLGHGLSAVFIQSQDGWTDFRSSENA